jgi:hypothetical protein
LHLKFKELNRIFVLYNLNTYPSVNFIIKLTTKN